MHELIVTSSLFCLEDLSSAIAERPLLCYDLIHFNISHVCLLSLGSVSAMCYMLCATCYVLHHDSPTFLALRTT